MTQTAQTTPDAPAAHIFPAVIPPASMQWIDWVLQGKGPAFATIINTPNDSMCKNALNQIPRFDHEDHPEVACLYMGFEQSNFEEGQIQLCLYLFDQKALRGGWWTGSMSQQYCKGNDASKTYYQKTLEQLEKIDIQIPNKTNVDWMSVMQQIIGKSFVIWVAEKESKNTGKKYYVPAALGVSDFAAPAPIAWPTMQMAAPAAPMAPAAPAAPAMPQMPAAPAVPQVTVADIPKANPFAR